MAVQKKTPKKQRSYFPQSFNQNSSNHFACGMNENFMARRLLWSYVGRIMHKCALK